MFYTRITAKVLLYAFLFATACFFSACGGGSSHNNGGTGTTTGGTTGAPGTPPPGTTTGSGGTSTTGTGTGGSTGSGTTSGSGTTTGSGTGGSTGSGGTGSGTGGATGSGTGGGTGAQPPQVTFTESRYKPGGGDIALLPDIPGNDLVVLTGNTVSIFVNHGDGTFGNNNNANATYFVGSDPRRLAVGDINGDGRPDIVTANHGDNTVSILYGQGGAIFSGPQQVQIARSDTHPFAVAIGDFNGNGRNDIAISAGGFKGYIILRNDGNGGFTQMFNSFQSDVIGDMPISLAAGDINGDGLTDLALLQASSVSKTGFASVVEIINHTPKGSGTFNFSDSVVETGTAVNLTLADIDGNGTADYLLPYSANSEGTQGLTWIFNFPDGTREKNGFVVSDPGTQVSFRAAVGDLNGDGQNDIALILFGDRFAVPDKITYVLGKGNRQFTDRTDVSIGGRQGPQALISAKLNNDQFWDLVTSNSESATLDVLLTQPK